MCPDLWLFFIPPLKSHPINPDFLHWILPPCISIYFLGLTHEITWPAPRHDLSRNGHSIFECAWLSAVCSGFWLIRENSPCPISNERLPGFTTLETSEAEDDQDQSWYQDIECRVHGTIWLRLVLVPKVSWLISIHWYLLTCFLRTAKTCGQSADFYCSWHQCPPQATLRTVNATPLHSLLHPL